MAPVAASLVVIGDEILDGHVADANTRALARALATQGVAIDRVHTVRDDADEIGLALHRELERSRPRLLVTSGGIGSTPDDITFEAVAAALGRPTETHPSIHRRIRRALDWQVDAGLEVDDEVTHAMMRMAAVPAGARLLDGLSGWVPGVVLDLDGGVGSVGGVTVAILPGVPSEFRRITHEGLVPLVAGRNPVPEVVEVTHGFPESLLNPAFARIGERHPDVKLGSYPGSPMLVRLTGPAGEVAAAAAIVQSHVDGLLATEAGQRVATSWADRTTTARPGPDPDSPASQGAEDG